MAVRQTFGSELGRIEQTLEGDLRILNKLWNHPNSSHTINGKVVRRTLDFENRNFEIESAEAEGKVKIQHESPGMIPGFRVTDGVW